MREMDSRFHLIMDEFEMVNVCFWYVPERLRDVKHDKVSSEQFAFWLSCQLFNQED